MSSSSWYGQDPSCRQWNVQVQAEDSLSGIDRLAKNRIEMYP